MKAWTPLARGAAGIAEPRSAPNQADEGLAVVRWFERRARAIDRLDRLDGLLDAARERLGFRYHALVHHGALDGPGAVPLALTNYPVTWRRRFGAGDLHRIDPVQRACRATLAGFRWSRLRGLTAQEQDLLGESRRHGLGDGFTVPLHMPAEPPSSCSFAMEPGERLPFGTLLAAQLLAQHAFEAARAMLGTAGRPLLQLSPRQRQCVALLAAGLTDRGIARRLGLSEETVTKYLNAARRRHGLARRAQLVAAALRDGAIGFDEIDRGMSP